MDYKTTNYGMDTWIMDGFLGLNIMHLGSGCRMIAIPTYTFP